MLFDAFEWSLRKIKSHSYEMKVKLNVNNKKKSHGVWEKKNGEKKESNEKKEEEEENKTKTKEKKEDNNNKTTEIMVKSLKSRGHRWHRVSANTKWACHKLQFAVHSSHTYQFNSIS